jgi:hypothetical protein
MRVSCVRRSSPAAMAVGPQSQTANATGSYRSVPPLRSPAAAAGPQATTVASARHDNDSFVHCPNGGAL